jgi:hypothetical protein
MSARLLRTSRGSPKGSNCGLTGSTLAMGIVISLVLIAFGAILTWAVHSTSSSIDVDVVGVVLMVVGFLVFLISIVLWRTWWGMGFWGGWYDDRAPVVRRRAYRPYRQRTTYVEEEEAATPEPPPPAP